MHTLDVFLAHADGPWRRGVSDCFVAAADQVHAWFGVDPMARYRGRYTSMHGYLRIVRKDGYGDALAAFRGELEASGFERVEDGPLDRDVALASYREAGKPTVAPALFFDGFWNVRSNTGWSGFEGMTGISEVYRWASK